MDTTHLVLTIVNLRVTLDMMIQKAEKNEGKVDQWQINDAKKQIEKATEILAQFANTLK